MILSAFEHLAAIASAYEAGASAYVTKTADAREVLEVISAVHHLTHARDRVFPGSLAADLANFYISGGRGGTSPQARLTAQQLKVFQMMADGIRVKDIAMRNSGINRRTVIQPRRGHSQAAQSPARALSSPVRLSTASSISNTFRTNVPRRCEDHLPVGPARFTTFAKREFTAFALFTIAPMVVPVQRATLMNPRRSVHAFPGDNRVKYGKNA